MRVLLVNPGWPQAGKSGTRRFNRAWPPLSLLITGALFKKAGHAVQLIDGRVDPGWRQRLEAVSGAFDRIILTSSPLDRWQCPNLEIDHFIAVAQSLPGEKLIVSGAHGTLFPQQMLRASRAQGVVVGPPEKTLLEMLSKSDWEQIPGIAFKKNGKSVFTGPPAPADLTQLPIPAFDLIDFCHYHYELLGSRFALFEGSRGCPYKCGFCDKSMYGESVHHKPVERLMQEITYAVKKCGVRSGYFIDLEFTLSRSRISNLCEQLIKAALPLIWCCQTRADTVDRELLKQMYRAGCRLIHYGVESGSQRILNAMQKQTNLEQIRTAVRLTHEAGIQSACFFLFGFPGETAAEMDQTLSFAKSLNPTYASFHILTPYPGSDLATHPFCAKAENGFHFPAHIPEHDPHVLAQMVKKAYKCFYLRPGYIVNRLARISTRRLPAQLRLFRRFIS